MRKYSKFFAIILALALVVPGVGQLAEAAPEDNVVRLDGDTRVETAVKASEEAYPEGAETVVLAGYHGTVDALTGTLLADAKEAPLLLTVKGELSEETETEIERLGAEKVYIVGGENVVGKEVENSLDDYNVERVDGERREETAHKIAKEVGGNTDHVFLALGHSLEDDDALADALAIGPASAKENMPVLLTQSDRLTKSTKEALEDLDVNKVTIVGGKTAITEDVEDELEDYDIVERVEGDRREETALKIAGKYFDESEDAVVAYGWRDADALVGGYLGALNDAPILLANTDKLHDDVETFLEDNTSFAYVLGGEKVISEEVYDKIVAAVGEDEDIIAAEKAVKEYEEKVDSAEKVEALVEDGEELQDVLALFTGASNKIKVLPTGDKKEALTGRLDDAHDIATAADFVNGLQDATEDLTEENIVQANIKLTQAKGNVSSLPEGEIKDALMDLIEVEENKIEEFENHVKAMEMVKKIDRYERDDGWRVDLTFEDLKINELDSLTIALFAEDLKLGEQEATEKTLTEVTGKVVSSPFYKEQEEDEEYWTKNMDLLSGTPDKVVVTFETEGTSYTVDSTDLK